MMNSKCQLHKAWRQLFLALGLGLATILVLHAGLTPIRAAYSQSGTIVPASEVTIAAVGEASISLQPDRVTLVIAKQSRIANSSGIVEAQQIETAEVVSAIRSALPDNDNTTISNGSFYLNPYYSSPMLPRSSSDRYTAYLNVPITVAVENVADAADKIAEAGFSVESVYLSPTSSMFPAYPGGFGYSEGIESPADETIDESEDTNATDSSQVTLNVAITSQPDTLANVMNQYEQLSVKIDELLEELGISEDKRQPPTANFMPDYNDFGYQPFPDSQYSLHLQVIVQTDPSNVDKIINAASSEGAYMESFYMSFSDTAIDNARIQLNQQALENAMEKANEMGSTLGLEVKAVKSISVGGSGTGLAGMPLYRGVNLAFPFPYSGTPSEQLSVTVAAEFQMG